MKKSELIETLSGKQQQLSKQDVSSAVNLLLDQISGSLCAGDRVEIRGFGSFSLRHWGPRFARNPKTGETWRTDPTYAVYFKAGQELRDMVNDEESEITPDEDEA